MSKEYIIPPFDSDNESENDCDKIDNCENCHVNEWETRCNYCKSIKICSNCYYICDTCFVGCCRFCSKKIYDNKDDENILCLTCYEQQ